jgi:hypothetical protein
MISPYDPLKATKAWTNLVTAYGQMSMAASEVILLRTMKMAQGAMTAGEAMAMVMEKATAFAAATEGAAVAAVTGGDAVRIASAALKPIRAKTRSNARMLRR